MLTNANSGVIHIHMTNTNQIENGTPVLVMANYATEDQLTQIRAHAVNDVTRAIMRDGITLTHEQADALGKETLGWIGGRLGLNVKETDAGVECTPPRHYNAGVDPETGDAEWRNWKYKVVLRLRGKQGKLVDFRTVARFDTEGEAHAYAERFAPYEASTSLVDVRARKGDTITTFRCGSVSPLVVEAFRLIAVCVIVASMPDDDDSMDVAIDAVIQAGLVEGSIEYQSAQAPRLVEEAWRTRREAGRG